MNSVRRHTGATTTRKSVSPQSPGAGEVEPRISVQSTPSVRRLCRFIRDLSYRVRLAASAPPLEQVAMRELESRNERALQLADEYSRGYMAGWQECFETCLEAVEDEIGQPEDFWTVGRSLTDSSRKDN